MFSVTLLSYSIKYFQITHTVTIVCIPTLMWSTVLSPFRSLRVRGGLSTLGLNVEFYWELELVGLKLSIYSNRKTCHIGKK